ncbi:MAG: oligosaccharide flippase family protein [Acidimicrobiales bacterium]
MKGSSALAPGQRVKTAGSSSDETPAGTSRSSFHDAGDSKPAWNATELDITSASSDPRTVAPQDQRPVRNPLQLPEPAQSWLTTAPRDLLLAIAAIFGGIAIGVAGVYDIKLAIALLGGFVVVGVVLVRPAIGGFILVAIVPIVSGFQPGIPVPHVRLSEALIGAVGVTVLVATRKKDAVRWGALDWLLLIYGLGWAAMAAVNALTMHEHLTISNWGTAIGQLQFFLIYRAVRVSLRTRKERRNALIAFLVASIPVSLLAIAQQSGLHAINAFIIKLTGSTVLGSPAYHVFKRATGPFDHWTPLAGYLITVLIPLVSFALFRTFHDRTRTTKLVTALSLAALMLTAEISAMGGLLAGAIALGVWARRSKKVLAWLGIGTLAVILAFGSYLGQRMVTEFGTSAGSSRSVGMPQTIAFRLQIWTTEYIPAIEARPLTGYGVSLPTNVDWQYTESQYITLLMEGGVLVLVLFGAMSWAMIDRARKSARSSDPVDVALGRALVVLSLVLIPMDAIWPYVSNGGLPQALWALFGLLAPAGSALGGSLLAQRSQPENSLRASSISTNGIPSVSSPQAHYRPELGTAPAFPALDTTDYLARGRVSRVKRTAIRVSAASLGRLRRRVLGASANDVNYVVGLLGREGIRVVIAGGWGIDALLHKKTRRHHDLDLIVNASRPGAFETDRAREILCEKGFFVREVDVVSSALFPHRLLLEDAFGRRIDLHPAELAPPNSKTSSEDASSSLPRTTSGIVGGQQVQCLSVDTQLAAHSGYSPRSVDRSDLAVLASIKNPPVPPPPGTDAHLATRGSDPERPLRTRGIEGGAYLMLREGAGGIIRLGGVLALTRLIGPSAFGRYATAAAIVTLGATVAQVGAEVYLIRHQDPSQRLFDIAFTLLCLTTACISAVLMLATFVAGGLLGHNGITPLLRILIIGLPLNVLWAPAQARIERSFGFGRLAILEVAADAALYIVALPLALMGSGAWAPVAGTLVWQAVRFLGSYRLAGSRPRFAWSRAEAVDMLRFGIPASVSMWRPRGARAILALVIGADLGVTAVGWLALSWRIIDMLSIGVRSTWRVALAGLARVKDDAERLATGLTDGTVLEVATLGVPLVVVTIASPFLVSTVFGPTWRSVFMVLPAMSAAALCEALFVVAAATFLVTHSPIRFAVAEIIALPVTAVVAILVVPRLGVVSAGLAPLAGVLVGAVPFISLRKSLNLHVSTVWPALIWILALVPALFFDLAPWPERILLVVALPLPLADKRSRAVLSEAWRAAINIGRDLRGGTRGRLDKIATGADQVA